MLPLRFFSYLCTMNNLDFNYFCKGCTQSEEYRRENCFTNYRVRKYKKGEKIAFCGDRVRELGIIVEGEINVSFVLESGLITRSVNHTAPVPIGAIALFSEKGKYLVDTHAITDCTLLSISKDEATAQMGKCPLFMTNFIGHSTSRVSALSKHLALLSQRSISSKLAYYILSCSKDGVSFKFTKKVNALAHLLCVERPSLSRVIAQFVDQKLITYKNGIGKITKLEALKSLVE